MFMIHGFSITAKIFSKVVALAPKRGLRIVSISRREDIDLMLGSDEDKAQYLMNRGLEFLRFMDAFIQQHHLPAPTVSEGKATAGGIAIAGWSLGNSFMLAALASISKLDSGAQARMSKYLRSIIFEDPPIVALGHHMPENAWNPIVDPQIPEHERLPFTVAWLTSYFNHGDLNKRDLNALTYALPSFRKVPSIYTWHEHYDELVCTSAAVKSDGSPGTDSLLFTLLSAQLKESYENVVFGEEMKVLLPNSSVWYFGREHSPPFCIAALWRVQEDNDKRGGSISFEVTAHAHYLHWDEPESAIASWMKALV